MHTSFSCLQLKFVAAWWEDPASLPLTWSNSQRFLLHWGWTVTILGKFSIYWTVDDKNQWSLSERKQTRWALQLPLHGKSFLAAGQGRGSQAETKVSPKLRWQKWKSEEAETTGVHRRQCWRGGSCTEKEGQRSAEGHCQMFTWIPIGACVWGNCLRPGKDPMKAWNGTILRAHRVRNSAWFH